MFQTTSEHAKIRSLQKLILKHTYKYIQRARRLQWILLLHEGKTVSYIIVLEMINSETSLKYN